MTGTEVRQSFLDFFATRGHLIVPSDRIVPASDPSLMFTNAGMVPFKNVFLGAEQPRAPRVADSQKCLRISGKHNDLDDVGRDVYHQTFFEMLGNWSFGDYYKPEAIEWAWELLTDVWGLPKDKLYATVFETDDEAAALWPKITDIDPSRVLRCGAKDNFWEMGETGPCGPCSEIHFDRVPEACDLPPGHECGVNSDCARYMEIWNLVFIQNDRQADGSLGDLPARHVDTGMGLERVVSILQGGNGNYDSDLLRGLIGVAEDMSGRPYVGGYGVEDIAFRVIADHARSVAVMIGDGILPSNEGRGYVLRRLLRRAARQAHVLGIEGAFLGRVTDQAVEILGSAYPELIEHRARIGQTVASEEERFGETLDKGLGLLTDERRKMESRGEETLSGEVAFRLYDTYGFPFDLTEDILRGEGLGVDREGFDRSMDAQRARGREGARFATATGGGFRDEKSSFVGYDQEAADSSILAMACDGKSMDRAEVGALIEIVSAETPFYGESGGQAGDGGTIELADGGLVEVHDTLKPRQDLIVHRGKVLRGTITPDVTATFRVDHERRAATRLNHSATHILHAALREFLGAEVHQAGSLVTAERLRFDFTYGSRVDTEKLSAIEDWVNARIRENALVSATEMAFDDALTAGALAFFGDKYGDQVRVLKMGDFSVELCGGTHVSRTGDIGLFKIGTESAVGAGVRRIEAATGTVALAQVRSREEEIRRLASLLKTDERELAPRVEKLLAQQKELERKIESTEAKLASGASRNLLEGVREVAGIPVLVQRVDGGAKVLRGLADQLRDKLGSGVVVLGGVDGAKVVLLAAVTADLTEKVQAGQIIREIAPIVGGAGGGRPDFAQAGGKDPAKLDAALARVHEFLAE
jgi:alanyl-tRNA synthetase